MIIRKPYAFLIKNFRKIHIALLILSIYVAYKLIDVNKFVNDFMSAGIYDLYEDPVTDHITSTLTFFVFLIVVGSFALLMLLRHKQKPWKLYLAPTISYLVLFFVLGMIKSFFARYSIDVETTDLRMSRDLLLIYFVVQVPLMGIFVMRILGLDINKFQFNIDQEFLELSEEDREEIEIGLNLDKNSFIRTFKRAIRNINYFYIEHKIICKVILGIICFIFLFNTYKLIFITNKTYKMGDTYSVDGYAFKVNKVYFTNKDKNGNVISDENNFVIVDISVHNRGASRNFHTENFHLKNRVKDYTSTGEMFNREFSDLGVSYESIKAIKRDERLDFIVIYRVEKKLRKGGFVLYYQESRGKLRKIKIKVTDISRVSRAKKLKVGDEMPINIKGKEDNITIEKVKISNKITYTTRKCKNTICNFSKNEYASDEDNTVLTLEFISDAYEAKNMIDFLNNYGKLIYKDSDGVEESIALKNPLTKKYYGKYVYLKVPVEVKETKSLRLEFIIRDKYYIYKLI